MSDPFAEFEAIRAKKKAEAQVLEKERKAKWKIVEADKERLDALMRKNLKAFHNKKVDGHKIQMGFKKDGVNMLIDNKLVAVFSIEQHWSHCSCEGPCDHETSYWHSVSVIEKKKSA